VSEFSLLDMVTELAAAEVAIHVNARLALEFVAQAVEKTAKGEVGVYQDAIGPFSEWPELAQSTQDQREHLGYSANDPLLRDGTMRDSISHKVEELEAQIGSDSDILVWQEFGTATIPPRPVLGPAAEHNHDLIVKELGGAVVAGLIGGDIVHASLGYDKTVSQISQ
jgi:hypothetical protein